MLLVDVGIDSLLWCFRCRYTDPKTHKLHQARVAVQLCVKPGAYKVSSARISDSDVDGAVEQVDAKFSNSELEWSTKERGSTSLSALLVHVDWQCVRFVLVSRCWIVTVVMLAWQSYVNVFLQSSVVSELVCDMSCRCLSCAFLYLLIDSLSHFVSCRDFFLWRKLVSLFIYVN